MKKFLDDNFLLNSPFAEELYHSYAKDLPIIDYHNHLPPNEIADNQSYRNMTELWLKGDHYKWRAMRSLGIEEKYITGNATDGVKFSKWAYTVPYTMRNPLYHWSHLELKRYFDLEINIKEAHAKTIYDHCNQLLKQPEYTAQGLLKKMKVQVVCTTDDPLDDLAHHKKLRQSDFDVLVLPTFRPDGVLNIEGVEFNTYIKTLSKITNIEIDGYASLLKAIQSRIDYFHQQGCRLSDHGLPHLCSIDFNEDKADGILRSKLKTDKVASSDTDVYQATLLHSLGKMYAEAGWTMQLHLGPIRDTNKALLKQIGINAGVDSIGDFPQAHALATFLDHLNLEGKLPKTIIYNSNPADNDVFATMAGNFSQGGIKGKVQFGAAWWFLDQKEGITRQLNSLSNMGLISTTIGMLTDSRSFLSFPRHEYYRRILCNLFGNDIKNGELPNDIDWIGNMISNICYYNAQNYFNFNSVKELKKIY